MDLLPILRKFKGRRVLVVGDLILDSYLWGKVSRISPEAPVPVVDVKGESFTLGGAANVAQNIISLGGRATVMGVAGRDRAAETLKELLADRGIDFTIVEDKRPTTVKTRVIAHSQQMVRFDQESRDYLSGKSLRGILDALGDAVRACDAVVVSDYRKGVITKEVIRSVLDAGGGRKFVAVDPKVGHFHLYRNVSLITPNLMEASQGAGAEIKNEKTLKRAGSKLLKKLGLQAVLITRGEEGMSLFHKEQVVHIPTLARKVYDVTGAGDTVIASYTLSRASGASLEESAIIANHAAGIVVAEVGTASATREKVRASMKLMKSIDIRRERL
jgi:D-beta-D-heptose 7-phosphate kinase/D-beta-D-heptose 1-phosphate adenosyltransferase